VDRTRLTGRLTLFIFSKSNFDGRDPAVLNGVARKRDAVFFKAQSKKIYDVNNKK
jgi:hypothetical protein